MPATFSPIDREAFVALQQGQEQTLERLFRDHYAALAGEAGPIVGDDASASKVVERAFVRAWKERERFETPEALTAFLHEAVHDQAKVMLHRRVMLHRIEEHEGAHAHAVPASAEAIPVDQAWAHVNEAIHEAALDRKALARETHEHSRHEAAHNMAAVAQTRSWKVPVAIGAVVIAALVALFWVIDRAGAEKAIVSSVNSPETQVLKSGAGQRGNIPLDDGSKVAIGADSKLYVAPRFGARMRAVKLEGTASFTVAPKQDMPFHVVVGPAVITATGTVFLVQAYPSDDTVVLQVRDGSVAVKRGSETQAVAKGHGLVIPASGAMTAPPSAMLAESFAWIDGRFVATDEPLRAVLRRFTRWYGIEFRIKDPAILDRPITIDASLDSSREAISALEQSGHVVFGYEGKQMTLADAPAAKTK